MKKNMGRKDRLIRTLIAALIVLLWATGTISGTLAVLLLIVAAVFVITSFVSRCPAYMPLGISTCKSED